MACVHCDSRAELITMVIIHFSCYSEYTAVAVSQSPTPDMAQALTPTHRANPRRPQYRDAMAVAVKQQAMVERILAARESGACAEVARR